MASLIPQLRKQDFDDLVDRMEFTYFVQTVQIIFYFLSFEISGGILRNQKINIGLDQSLKIFCPIWIILDLQCILHYFIDYPVERCKITVILFGSMLPNL